MLIEISVMVANIDLNHYQNKRSIVENVYSIYYKKVNFILLNIIMTDKEMYDNY